MSTWSEAWSHMMKGGLATFGGHQYRVIPEGDTIKYFQRLEYSNVWSNQPVLDTHQITDKWLLIELPIQPDMPASQAQLTLIRPPERQPAESEPALKQPNDFTEPPPPVKMNHVMVDTETYGTKPGCVVRSIGAVFFNLQGDIGPTFYRNITPQSCLDIGLVIDPETEDWWAKQGADAQAALLVNQAPIADVIEHFIKWWWCYEGNYVWCQGANYDAPILEAVMDKLGLAKKVPWKYYNVRDTRTAYQVYGFNAKGEKRAGTYHNALDDAMHQVRCVLKAKGISV